MSNYLGASAVREKGREFRDWKHGEAPEAPPGYRIVALLNNELYEKAVDVTDPEEFRTFDELDRQGQYIGFELFLLKEELVQECPNTGGRRV